MPLPETFTGPGGGEYTLLDPQIFTVTTRDGRTIRMCVADLLAFADWVRKWPGEEKSCR